MQCRKDSTEKNQKSGVEGIAETKKVNKDIRKIFVVKRGLKVITIEINEIKHERVWG